MTVSNWTEAHSNRALEIWSEYQQNHDVSERAGQTAGIDPVRGSIWFGDSIQGVIAQRNAAGSEAPLFFTRVGSATYYRKAGRLHIWPQISESRKTYSLSISHSMAGRFERRRRLSTATRS